MKTYTMDDLKKMGRVETRINGKIAVVMGKTAKDSPAFVRGDDGAYRPMKVVS